MFGLDDIGPMQVYLTDCQTVQQSYKHAARSESVRDMHLSAAMIAQSSEVASTMTLSHSSGFPQSRSPLTQDPSIRPSTQPQRNATQRLPAPQPLHPHRVQLKPIARHLLSSPHEVQSPPAIGPPSSPIVSPTANIVHQRVSAFASSRIQAANRPWWGPFGNAGSRPEVQQKSESPARMTY
jgi:hypothetical protein